MIRFTRTLAMALALGFGLAGAAAAQDGTIRIGTEGAYPPFNFTDSDGNLQGFDIDIANALCAAMDAECAFVVQDWDGIIPGLLAKKYDAIIASMSITDERKKVVDFTDKYYQTPARFIAPTGSDIVISKAGLDGKVVGVQRATIHENFLRDNFGGAAEVRAYATQEDANMDLVNGRVDLVLADSVVLSEGFLNTDEGEAFAFIGPSFTDPNWFGDGAGIAVRKDDTALRDRLSKAISMIRADGTYDEIAAKYFDFDVYGN